MGCHRLLYVSDGLVSPSWQSRAALGAVNGGIPVDFMAAGTASCRSARTRRKKNDDHHDSDAHQTVEVKIKWVGQCESKHPSAPRSMPRFQWHIPSNTRRVSHIPDRPRGSNRTIHADILGKTTERMIRRKAELRPAALCVSVRNVFPCCADRAEATIAVLLVSASHASGAGAVALSCFPVFRKELGRRSPATSVVGTGMPTAL